MEKSSVISVVKPQGERRTYSGRQPEETLSSLLIYYRLQRVGNNMQNEIGRTQSTKTDVLGEADGRVATHTRKGETGFAVGGLISTRFPGEQIVALTVSYRVHLA